MKHGHHNFANAQGTPKKFDATQLASMGLDLIVGTISSQTNAKKQRQLQEKLAKMSLQQQKELEERLQDTNSNLERLNIMYQTFAVLENQKLIDGRKNKQLILIGILGGGVLLLTGLAIFYKRK